MESQQQLREVRIKIEDITNAHLKDMPCSICHTGVDVKELYINKTMHSVCKDCREYLCDKLMKSKDK